MPMAHGVYLTVVCGHVVHVPNHIELFHESIFSVSSSEINSIPGQGGHNTQALGDHGSLGCTPMDHTREHDAYLVSLVK